MRNITRRSAVNALVGAAGLSIPVAASALVPDPIFAAIEAYKRAYAAYGEVLDQQSVLEKTIPAAKCRWSWKIQELYPPADCLDDACWLAQQKREEISSRDVDSAQLGLLTTRATTPAGLAALLRYVYDYHDRGCEWPDLIWGPEGNLSTRHLLSATGALEDEEDIAHDFEVELCWVVADSLAALGGSS